MINEKMNKKIKPIFKESQQYDFITDISRAAAVLHFQPKTRIKDGLSNTIERFWSKNILDF